MHFRDSIQDRRLCLTNDGRLAIVSRSADIGDQIVILQGADSPCLLRSRAEDSWTLISGDCAVFGGINDSRLEDQSLLCDTYLDKYDLELETFNIH